MPPLTITPHIYQIQLPIVNVFVIRIPTGIAIIDTGPAGSQVKIFDEIRKIGFQPADIRRIVVTHAHHDHSGSLAAIVKKVNAAVYMHPADAALVKKGIAYNFRSKLLNSLITLFTLGSVIKLPRLNIAPVENVTPVNDGDLVPGCNGLQVIYAPGHWPGQIALFYPGDGGVIFAADTAENFKQLKLSPGNDNIEESRATIKRMMQFDFNIAVFSHGRPILNRAAEIFREVFTLS